MTEALMVENTRTHTVHMLTTLFIMTMMFPFITRNASVNVHKQSPNMDARWAHIKTMPPSRCVQVFMFALQ